MFQKSQLAMKRMSKKEVVWSKSERLHYPNQTPATARTSRSKLASELTHSKSLLGMKSLFFSQIVRVIAKRAAKSYQPIKQTK